MRPVLKPALRVLWRDESTVQLGVGAGHAVMITNVGAEARRVLQLLDGSRDWQQLMSEAGGQAPLLSVLRSAEALDDVESLRGELEPGQSAQLAALSLLHRAPRRGRAALTGRAGARVAVLGLGPVGRRAATLLVDAGLPRVPVLPWSGTGASIWPDPDCLRPHLRVLDLVLLAPDGAEPVPPVIAADLVRLGVPHLVAAVRENRAVVGPLVAPGFAPCLHCLDLTRTERDPGWPRIAAQLSVVASADSRPGGSSGVDAADAPLVGLTASLAAMEVAAALDAGTRSGLPARHELRAVHHLTRALAALGGEGPQTVGGALEVDLADPTRQVHRRVWPLHPACPCRDLAPGAEQAAAS